MNVLSDPRKRLTAREHNTMVYERLTTVSQQIRHSRAHTSNADTKRRLEDALAHVEKAQFEMGRLLKRESL